MFIRVEHDVGSIRHIIRIHRHTLEIVGSVHKDTDLGIVRITKVQIRHATPNFYDTIFQSAALIAVKDLHPA